MNNLNKKVQEFGGWAVLGTFLKQKWPEKNFHRRFNSYVKKLNSWLKPLNLELTVKELSEDELPNPPNKK